VLLPLHFSLAETLVFITMGYVGIAGIVVLIHGMPSAQMRRAHVA